VATLFACQTLRDVQSRVDFPMLKAMQVSGLDCHNTFLVNKNHLKKC